MVQSTIAVEIPGLDALAADLKRIAGAIDAHDNSTAGIAVRAIQLMREAGEQRDEYKAALDRVLAIAPREPNPEMTVDSYADGWNELLEEVRGILTPPAAPAVVEADHA